MDTVQDGLVGILLAATIVGVLLAMWVALFEAVNWYDAPAAFVVGFVGTLCFAAGIAAVGILFMGLWVVLSG